MDKGFGSQKFIANYFDIEFGMRNFVEKMKKAANYFVGVMVYLMYAVYYALVTLSAGVIVWLLVR